MEQPQTLLSKFSLSIFFWDWNLITANFKDVEMVYFNQNSCLLTAGLSSDLRLLKYDKKDGGTVIQYQKYMV